MPCTPVHRERRRAPVDGEQIDRQVVGQTTGNTTVLGPRVTAVVTLPAGSSATAAASVRPGRRRARHRCGVSTSALSRGTVCATSTPAPPGYPSARRGPPPMSRQAWCGPPTSSTPSPPASASVPGTESSPAAWRPAARSRGWSPASVVGGTATSKDGERTRRGRSRNPSTPAGCAGRPDRGKGATRSPTPRADRASYPR